jgi:hypothetical protein
MVMVMVMLSDFSALMLMSCEITPMISRVLPSHHYHNGSGCQETKSRGLWGTQCTDGICWRLVRRLDMKTSINIFVCVMLKNYAFAI